MVELMMIISYSKQNSIMYEYHSAPKPLEASDLQCHHFSEIKTYSSRLLQTSKETRIIATDEKWSC